LGRQQALLGYMEQKKRGKEASFDTASVSKQSLSPTTIWKETKDRRRRKRRCILDRGIEYIMSRSLVSKKRHPQCEIKNFILKIKICFYRAIYTSILIITLEIEQNIDFTQIHQKNNKFL